LPQEATMTRNRVILDIETQRDFFHPNGSSYRPEASLVAKNIYRLIRCARKRHVPVISTVLRIRPGDLGPLASVPHCIEGTTGEMKMARTLLAHRMNLGLRNITDLPPGLLHQYQQVIIEKRYTDIFRHSRIERLISEMPATTLFIVCGAGLGQGIVEAVIGLRSRGLGVIVPRDAVLMTDGPHYALPLERMEAKGALIVATDKIILPPRFRPVGHPAGRPVGRWAGAGAKQR